MLRRDRLVNTTWTDIDDRVPERQACWLVTLVCSLLMMAGVIACCWAVGFGERIAMVLFR